MRLIDFLSDEERQQLRIRYDDASFPDYVNELLNKEVNTVKHARWERHYSRPNVFADLYWHCSECGYKNGNQWAHRFHKYCPNCGLPILMDEASK